MNEDKLITLFIFSIIIVVFLVVAVIFIVYFWWLILIILVLGLMFIILFPEKTRGIIRSVTEETPVQSTPKSLETVQPIQEEKEQKQKICSSCQSSNDVDAQFCKKCGTKI